MEQAKVLILVLCWCSMLWFGGTEAIPEWYSSDRSTMIGFERQMRVGEGLVLNRQELEVDALLKADKRQIVEAARLNGSYFPAGHNFLIPQVRRAMENTTGFQIIKQMPKGGILHMHKTAIVSLDWVIGNVTYRPNLHFCVDANSILHFKFAASSPAPTGDCAWQLLSEYRGQLCSGSQPCLDNFDSTIYRNLSLVTDDPDTTYPDLNSVWVKFESYFNILADLLDYTPVWRDYTWMTFQQMMEDNVQYIEIRGNLPKLYELDGSSHSRTWCIDNMYKPLIQQFKDQNPTFIGAKFILTKFRSATPAKVLSYVQEAMNVYQSYGDFVVGFDLVGQEDPYNPLVDFIDPLLYPQTQSPPVNLPYLFHAGETVWQRTASDLNLVDALLLNATRIGHGYALHKHPLLMEIVQQEQIAVEVNPISNQVLKLVADLRNHPAAVLLARGFPIVISSDDPAIWDALPLSHDFYVAFMALTGEDAGLAELKQLSENSITYSQMSYEEKIQALAMWEGRWNTFIDDVCRSSGSTQCDQE